MGKIIDINEYQKKNEVDGSDIKEYVYDKLDIDLPIEAYIHIDLVMYEIWTDKSRDGIVHKDEVVEMIIERFKKEKIMIGYCNVYRIVEMIFEGLEKLGYAKKC